MGSAAMPVLRKVRRLIIEALILHRTQLLTAHRTGQFPV